MSETAIPAGMVVVSRDEFYARLYADPRDIMPSVRFPDVTIWETRDRVEFGRTLPGWRDGGNPNVPKVYMLTDAAYATLVKAEAAE